ncbi:MAG TPA: ABC transporter permease [bacterium]|nr:ABC transporter permease [bacterium]
MLSTGAGRLAPRPLPPATELAGWRHEFRAAYAIWLRELIRFVSERTRIVGALGQPLIYLAIMGTGFGASFRSAAVPGGFSYLRFMYPGVLGMTVLFTAMFSAISIIWDREFGFLKEILVAPVARVSIVAGKVLGGATVATLQGVLLLALAPIVGVRLGPAQILGAIIVMLLVAAALTSLGLVIASRMATMEGFQVVMNFLVLPLWLLSGAFFPLRGLPVWMAVLTRIDPLTYAVDGLRGIVYGGSPLAGALVVHPYGLDVAIIALAVVVMLTAAIATFRSGED